MDVTPHGASFKRPTRNHSCGHGDLYRAGGNQAMEEGERGDEGGAAASLRELALAPCRNCVSVCSWTGCSGSTLLASAWANTPGPGIYALPELGKDKGYLSETVFTSIFLTFVLWTFHPFIYHSKHFYTVLLWRRVLAFLVASQFLRIVTFYSTQLPGPNYHCREGSALATLPPPKNVLDVLLINFPRGVLFGCGDLIFSSHMIFTLVFVRTYHKYGSNRLIKLFAWLMAIIQSLLIIASRKHYSVDVVVAWYTVNLVVFFIDKNLPEMPDRTNGSSLLPVSTKDKDDRTKEELHKPEKDELHKLLNGNTVDSTDWRQRVQMNGKHGEDTNHKLTDATPNGT